jgi:hypothetical protein
LNLTASQYQKTFLMWSVIMLIDVIF